MKLAEVIKGENMPESIKHEIIEIAGKLSKTSVKINEVPGFVVNQCPLWSMKLRTSMWKGMLRSRVLMPQCNTWGEPSNKAAYASRSDKPGCMSSYYGSTPEGNGQCPIEAASATSENDLPGQASWG